MEFLKTIGSKLVGTAALLAVIIAAVGWWQMEPAARDKLLGGAGRILAWLGVVAVLPFAAFALIGRVARMGSNLAGGVLVATFTLLELLLLLWLWDWSISGRTAWTFLAVGVLLAGVYNVLLCDWIASKL
jgi:hypothetical protein